MLSYWDDARCSSCDTPWCCCSTAAAMLLAAEEGAADERPCLTMFESKEEVERTMLALKIFPDIDQVIEAEQEDPETDEEEYAPQVHRSPLLTF